MSGKIDGDLLFERENGESVARAERGGGGGLLFEIEIA